MMKKILILMLLTFSTTCFAEDFYILKVNRVEKLWVIPPDRRSFIGSKGIQKFDYARPIRSEEQGEHYVVTWRYRGEKLSSPLLLKFEYRLALNQKEPYVEEYSYTDIKSGKYRWTFKNVGTKFAGEGKVDRWKVSLLLDGNVMAEKRSSSWKAMEGT